jgi:hypothetical protein
LRDSNKNLGHVFDGIRVIGWMKMEIMLLHTFSVEVAYLGGVYVILILKA